MSSHGDKTRAGMLLSSKLREIAGEHTEVKAESGEVSVITKAEAVARLIFNMALGYTEDKEVTDSDGKRYIKTVTHAPDKGMIALLFDRLEGKAGAMENDSGALTVRDKVSEEATKRINKLGNKPG